MTVGEDKENTILNPREIVIHNKSSLSSSFSETFIYEPSNKEEVLLGTLMVVAQVYSNKKKKENAEIATKISETLKSEYYRNSKRGTARSFKISLKRVETVLSKKKSWHSSSLKINLIVSVIDGPRIMLAQIGEGVAYFFRDKKVFTVKIREKHSPRIGGYDFRFGEITEGKMLSKDGLIISTKEIYKINFKDLKKLIAGNDLENFIYDHEEEFSGLALISVGSSKKTSGLAEDVSSKEKSTEIALGKIMSFSRIFRGSIYKFLIIAILVLSLTSYALVTHRNNEGSRERGLEIISQSEIFGNKISDLVELENYPEAESMISEWKKIIEELDSLKIFEKEVEEQNRKIEDAIVVVRKIKNVSPRTVIDLRENSIDFSPSVIATKDGLTYLFAGNTIYRETLGSSNGGFIVLPSLRSGEDFTVIDALVDTENQNRALILGKSLIASYDDEFETITENELLDQAISIESYQDSYYILDNENIWFAETDDLENIKKWDKENIFSEGKDIAIDGFIYVLENKKIHKFLNGQIDSQINIESGIEKIYTSSLLDNIYLLNPNEGYVVVMNKLREIKERLFSEDLRGASDFSVDEKENTLWLISGQRVFSFSISPN